MIVDVGRLSLIAGGVVTVMVVVGRMLDCSWNSPAGAGVRLPADAAGCCYLVTRLLRVTVILKLVVVIWLVGPFQPPRVGV